MRNARDQHAGPRAVGSQLLLGRLQEVSANAAAAVFGHRRQPGDAGDRRLLAAPEHLPGAEQGMADESLAAPHQQAVARLVGGVFQGNAEGVRRRSTKRPLQ
jgi:hypothetical protein